MTLFDLKVIGSVSYNTEEINGTHCAVSWLYNSDIYSMSPKVKNPENSSSISLVDQHCGSPLSFPNQVNDVGEQVGLLASVEEVGGGWPTVGQMFYH